MNLLGLGHFRWFRGESYTVGCAESESEVEIAGKPEENQMFRDEFFEETDKYYGVCQLCSVFICCFPVLMY